MDYAVEAMKQGSATVGIKSEDYAVLAALKVSPIDSPICLDSKLRQLSASFFCHLLGAGSELLPSTVLNSSLL